jgi:4-hydroxybenzoate polyprenyltransferase
METLGHFFRMIKFEHTVFALPLAYAGAILGAGGWPEWQKTILILGAMVGARTAAMAFNRLADHTYDSLNPRTSNRELPAGKLRRPVVTTLLCASILLFLVSALALDPWCFYLSPLALLVVLGYSYTKRFTWTSHLFLGLALAFAPVGGYLAVAGRLDWPVILIASGVMCWVAGFDVIYACQDVSFDRRVGLHSIPARVGIRRALRFSSAIHLAAFALFVWAGILAALPWPYFAAILIIGILLILEHRLVGPEKLDRINAAFYTINSYVSVTLLAGVAAAFSI